jgi:tRNA threonylcarbamoyladenosine biosynthesis protein TsaB
MLILAIDCALDACATAVLDSDSDIVVASETRIMTRGHAEALMPLIARVMDNAAVEFSGIDRIAVTVGPGSFTGLRVGIAAARGIALAAAKPAVGLTTLAGLAAPYIAQDDNAPVLAAIDARHDHVYMQMFGPGGRTLVAPRIAPLREAVRAATRGPAHIVGSAAALVAAAWPDNEPPPASVDPRGAPDISWIARLGAAAASGEDLPTPLYLRPPDAQPQAAARLPRR